MLYVPDTLECEIKSWNDNELTKGEGKKKGNIYQQKC